MININVHMVSPLDNTFFLSLNEMLIFCVDAETEVPLDSPEDDDPFKVPAHASPFDQPANTDGETPRLQVTEASPFNPSGVRMGDGNDVAGKKTQQQQEELEEERDQYTIEISITEPMKKGDGMSAYMAYKVNTKV